MSDNTDKDVLASELEDRAYTAIAYIIRKLATSYVEKIGDTLTVNDTMLKTMSIMIGEMIACYPENEREDTHGRVTKTIELALEHMALELDVGGLPEPASEPVITSDGTYDLAKMKPQGNC